MKVVVTGSSHGMGREICMKFLHCGHVVCGIDVDTSTIEHPAYTHYVADVSDIKSLPTIDGVNILINNAGTQLSPRGDMLVNFFGLRNCTEKYALSNPNIVSILNQASVSAHTGAEFPEYCASKGAVLAYTKWTANEVAEYGATCNSISCGGVLTDLNYSVINDSECWSKIMELTPLKRWATCAEIAEWVYFFTVVNKSCTGQDLIIDNGETTQTHFVWK